MGITSHGPANPAIHHPGAWEAEQHWRGLCGVCGQACVEASLPAQGQPVGRSTGWEVGIWTRNLAATVVNVLSCVSGLGMVPAPAGASVAFPLLGSTWGWCLRGASAQHWVCCPEGNSWEVKDLCTCGIFMLPGKFKVVGWHLVGGRWLPGNLLITFLRSWQDCRDYSVTVMKWAAKREDRQFLLQDGRITFCLWLIYSQQE